MPTIQEMYIGKRIEREQQVLSKVLGDPATRAALRERPKATLESIYGVQFPEGTDIRVLEEQVGSHYVVLPPEGLGAGGGRRPARDRGGRLVHPAHRDVDLLR